MEQYEEQDYNTEKFSAGVWKRILSKVFKRKKNIIIMVISVILLILNLRYTAYCFVSQGM